MCLQYDNIGLFGFSGQIVFNNYDVNVCYVVMLVVSFGVVYVYMDVSVLNFDSKYGIDLKWYQVDLQVVYKLLCCIDLYVEVMFQYVFGCGYQVFINMLGGVLSMVNQVVGMIGMCMCF